MIGQKFVLINELIEFTFQHFINNDADDDSILILNEKMYDDGNELRREEIAQHKDHSKKEVALHN